MSLFAIGDLHLHFGCAVRPNQQMNDGVWRNHEARFLDNCRRTVSEEDTLVLVGDSSFARKLPEAAPDFEYIMGLPGRKVLVRGNHDSYWDAKKTHFLREKYDGQLLFLQGNYIPYGNIALVGTKGFTFEGPFYLDRRNGRILGWDEEAEEHAIKIVDRELERLRQSFEAARADGFTRFVMFLHYPPTNILEETSGFTEMAEEYHAEQVIYAHCHGESRFHDSLIGRYRNVEYHLVSGDYLKWKPFRVL